MSSAQPQPHSRRHLGHRMKLHLRVRRIAGRELRILTPRPGTRVAFSVNHYHGTWHLLTDDDGARLLAHLLWGLSYQREPGTIVALAGEFLCPTPFEADRPTPIVLAASHLRPPKPQVLRGLKAAMRRLGAPDRSVRLNSLGLERAAANEAPRGRYPWPAIDRERVSLRGGWVVYTAPPEALRWQALAVHRMKADPDGFSYHYLDESDRRRDHAPGGEIQLFSDLRQRVSRATVARRRVLGRDPVTTTDGERAAIWAEVDRLKG